MEGCPGSLQAICCYLACGKLSLGVHCFSFEALGFMEDKIVEVSQDHTLHKLR